jgi:rhodanese-related sulfurtransferase
MNQDITVEELKAKMDSGEDYILIDVREVEEYNQFNLNGQLIPLGILPFKLEELEDLKDREVIVHCRSGMRSNNAKQLMIQNGFSNVRNLLGGILDWQDKFNK